MIYRELKRTGQRLSAIGLGGHEFLPNGRSRGFNEDFAKATRAGVVLEGFGGPARRALVAFALKAEVNFFDATIDSEKEALGRNLSEAGPGREVFIQTRPEGMVYRNNPDNPDNRSLKDLGLLRAEVGRGLALLRRDRLDFLNIGIEGSALANDGEFLPKLAANITALKAEGLIRYACADTFAGEATYLAMIGTGVFDSIFLNFNFGDDFACARVLPECARRGMGVFVREVFLKGALWEVGREAGFADRDALARAAVKWVLARPEVTVAVLGARDEAQFASHLSALDAPGLSPAEAGMIEAMKRTGAYAKFRDDHLAFYGMK
jgi:aryl-alcohol dehydrogenase-like predicted oxidoreductase